MLRRMVGRTGQYISTVGVTDLPRSYGCMDAMQGKYMVTQHGLDGGYRQRFCGKEEHT